MIDTPTPARRPDTLRKQDPRPIPDAPGEIRLFTCVQDEALRLPWLLDHHRRLGVQRFFVVDNASTDGTAAFLLSQPDVHSFHVRGSFRDAGFGVSWINTLLDAFGHDHWCVCIDGDELLSYPRCESVPLSRLTAYLDDRGMRVLFALVLDLYAEGPIRAAAYAAGQPFTDASPFFDPSPYETRRGSRFPFFQLYGGPRERVFWAPPHRNPEPPMMSKLPLIRWTRGMRFVHSVHSLAEPVPLADLRGAVLHFKFFHDFPERVAALVARDQHYGGSREYRRYAAVLAEQPDLSLHHPGSVRYEGPRQLEALGLMLSSPAYRAFTAART